MKKKIKKTKVCLCGEVLGSKVRTCPKCSHKFIFKKHIKNAKKCPNCTEELRPRAKICNKCKYEYPRKSKRFEEIPDWKKLKKGDRFILRKGSRGPYYQNGETKILMAERGNFTVHQIKKDGIIAYSQSSGFTYIHMGKTIFIEDTMIHRRSYKIFRKVK